MKLSKKELTDAMKVNSLALTAHNGTVEQIVTRDWDTTFGLEQIDTLVRSIRRNPVIVQKSSRAGIRLIRNLRNTHLPFLCCLKARLARARQEHPRHCFHPHIELFSDVIDDSVLPSSNVELPLATRAYAELDEREKIAMAHRLMNAFNKLHQRAKTKAFEAKIENFIRPGNKRHKELALYMNGLFRSHSSLFFIRADLGYSKSNDWPTDLGMPIDFQMVQQHLSAMTNGMKSTFARDRLVGYALKMEHGLHKGFQVQALFVFGGEQADDAAGLVQRIAALWQTDATGGKGLFYDCSKSRIALKACGTGLIQRDDKGARDGLSKAIAYMTKTDRYMAIRAPKGVRTFRKGIIPRDSARRRKGIA